MPLHPLLEEWDSALTAGDPLSFPGYRPPAEGESVRTGLATIDGVAPGYVLIEGRFDVMGGSMGAAAGEKVVRAYDRAVDAHLPVVVCAASGGARMQEGMVALIQLPRTATAASRHARAGLLSVAILRGPTTGGVLASYTSLADVRAAEPAATIGFAGPRVVELTTGHAPAGDSHTAEAAFAAGAVDALVPRAAQADWLETALGVRDTPLVVRDLPERSAPGPMPDGAWLEVQLARAVGRPSGIDWAATLCASWTELRSTDATLRAGLATLAGRRAVVLATDRYARSATAAPGRLGAAAYRLARRAVDLAGRLGLPLVTFVDTPGADPGPESEREGIASEIARTFAAMASLPTPSVAVCVGEGGSGGALALAHADLLLMLEHAVFSVIAPEAAAVILRRDPADAASLAGHLAVTAGDLLRLGIVDEIVAEVDGAVALAVRSALDRAVVGRREVRIDAATSRWIR